MDDKKYQKPTEREIMYNFFKALWEGKEDEIAKYKESAYLLLSLVGSGFDLLELSYLLFFNKGKGYTQKIQYSENPSLAQLLAKYIQDKKLYINEEGQLVLSRELYENEKIRKTIESVIGYLGPEGVKVILQWYKVIERESQQQQQQQSLQSTSYSPTSPAPTTQTSSLESQKTQSEQLSSQYQPASKTAESPEKIEEEKKEGLREKIKRKLGGFFSRLFGKK